MSETQEKVNMQKDSQDNSMANDVKSETLNSDNIGVGEQPNSVQNDNSKSGAYNQNNSINNNNPNGYSNAWNERNNEGYYNVNNNGYNNGYRFNGDGYNNNRYDNDYNYYNRERYNNNQNNYQESHTSKMGLGVLFALFLGVIGLLIGICLYSEEHMKEKHLLKAGTIPFLQFLEWLLL